MSDDFEAEWRDLYGAGRYFGLSAFDASRLKTGGNMVENHTDFGYHPICESAGEKSLPQLTYSYIPIFNQREYYLDGVRIYAEWIDKEDEYALCLSIQLKTKLPSGLIYAIVRGARPWAPADKPASPPSPPPLMPVIYTGKMRYDDAQRLAITLSYEILPLFGGQEKFSTSFRNGIQEILKKHLMNKPLTVVSGV